MTVPYYRPTTWQSTASPISTDPWVFPALAGQLLTSEKSPSWPGTIKKRAASGRQVRSGYMTSPIWQFRLAWDVLRERPTVPRIELQQLWAFYCSREGSLGTFFYLDPFDNSVTDEPFGTGDGTTTTFQLTRTVNSGGVLSFQEPIRVIRGTPVIKKAGTPTVAFTIGTAGQITFTTAPTVGQALTWTGSFLFWCHFTQDNLKAEQMYFDLWSQGGLTFETDKP